jgi:hypothetical protein
MTYFKETNANISFSDNASIDAFGRLRVSNPVTIFDSKNIFDDPDLATSVENQDLFYDNAETSGTGTSTTYNANKAEQIISVSTSAGTRVRQTKRRFNYLPGKSQLILTTFNMNNTATNITKRIGFFDEENGLFLEFDGTTINFVRRTYVTGTTVDNDVAQASWNIDSMDGNGPSGITLDWSKTQIMFIDFEWLGVGRARMGFVIDGLIYYAHEFLNTNILAEVYMSTPNLPIRAEISNNGSGAANSLTCICSSVMSEGGVDPSGQIRSITTSGTEVSLTTENTIYALLGIQLKSNYLGTDIEVVNTAIQIQTASHQVEWLLYLNPTVGGTFNYSNSVNRSCIQYAIGTNANTVSGGYLLSSGYSNSGGNQTGAAGSISSSISNALKLGSTISGTSDSFVLCARPIGGSSAVDVEASITWKELI